ncbi:HNH endonuclease [Streptomonospora arabica]|uniref:HNH endonuclease n=1 Tax=Streptomonospora arabica TaxID=412417 RepID=A0ABV9SSK8_9ACTN
MAISKRLRYEILRRDNHTCRYCGATAPNAELTIDHVTPKALGGDDKPENLVAACVDCNGGKTSTSPDAPLVADVADDAVRWAGAMAIAAQEVMEDSQKRDRAHQIFLRTWKDRGDPELPDGWRGSIDSLLASGLPAEQIAECVDIAADRGNVAPHNRFKYVCGVGWRKVEKLRERAEQIASAQKAPTQDEQDEDEDEDEGIPSVPTSVLEAAKELLDVLHDNEREIYLSEAGAEYGDVSDTALHYLAIDKAMDALTHQRWKLEMALRDILALYPDDEVDRQLEASRQKHLDLIGDLPSYADTLSQAALELTRHDRATAYLSRIPEAERGEWEAVARTYLGAETNDREVLVFAAEHAENNKRIEPDGQVYVLHGMCMARGDHGASCPFHAEHLAFVDACGEDPCTGHEFCGRHLELLLAGEYISRHGGAVNVHDFTDLPDAGRAGVAETNTKGE